VRVVGGQLHLRVADDGIGPPTGREATAVGNGVPNLAKRARRLGGFFTMVPGKQLGTVVEW
jgi:signal transduction histidine kinase